MRQQIELSDVILHYGPLDKYHPEPTTTAALEIVNNGRTFSRVRGQIFVDRLSGKQWRPVTRIDVAERGIVPGVTLELGDDLHRRLPSGKYRLRGQLYVDGRRVKPIEKEIAFGGDPAVDAVAYDTSLLLEPSAIQISLVPDATRTTTLRIENSGEYPVRIKMTT